MQQQSQASAVGPRKQRNSFPCDLAYSASGRTQSAFSEGGLAIGAGLEDLGKGLRSQTGTLYGTVAKGTRYLELTEGYITKQYLDANNEVCGYEYVHLGKMMEAIKNGMDANEAMKKFTGSYGRTTEEQGAVKAIDPRKE